MDTPTRSGRAAVVAGAGTLVVAVAALALAYRGSGGPVAVQQVLPAADPSPSATATPTPTPTPTTTPSPPATTTPVPTSPTAAPIGPPPTLGAPFGYPPGAPYAYGQPWTGGPPRSVEPSVDSPPGQAFRYRMYTCTNYEVKEGAPAAYHCVPEVDRYAEQRRYDGFYGQQNQGYSGTPQQPQAYPQPQGQYYPTQPYTYSSPSPGSVYFADCTAARNAGYTNIQRGSAGYSTTLDRDNDGVACETGE